MFRLIGGYMLLRLVVGVVAVTTRAGVMVMGAVLRWVFAVGA